MKLFRFLFLALLSASSFSAHAQLAWSYPLEYSLQPTGDLSGYSKLPNRSVAAKLNTRLHCATAWGYAFSYPYTLAPDSLPFFNVSQGNAIHTTRTYLLNNGDSMLKKMRLDTEGPMLYNLIGTIYRGRSARRLNNNCINCVSIPPSGSGTKAMFMSTFNEYAMDTSLSAVPYSPQWFQVDTNTNSVTMYHTITDPFNDSIVYWMNNINPSILTLNSAVKDVYPQSSYFYSRIFRYHDYPNITSPEGTNRATIVALRNRPTTYHFGYVDKENDSISIAPLHWQISNKNFHYWSLSFSELSSPYFDTDTTLQKKYKSGMRDSVENISYKTGFSPANPFGPNSNYSLNQATGDISFTAREYPPDELHLA